MRHPVTHNDQDGVCAYCWLQQTEHLSLSLNCDVSPGHMHATLLLNWTTKVSILTTQPLMKSSAEPEKRFGWVCISEHIMFPSYCNNAVSLSRLCSEIVFSQLCERAM